MSLEKVKIIREQLKLKMEKLDEVKGKKNRDLGQVKLREIRDELV